MRAYREREADGMALAVDQRYPDGFRVGGRVLDGQPLVVANVAIAFGKAVVAHAGRARLTNDIGAALGSEAAAIAVVRVVEEHLAFDHDLCSGRDDFRRNVLVGSQSIDVPVRNALCWHTHSCSPRGTIAELKGDGDAGR